MSENGKKMFKHVYNEDPVEFKKDCGELVGQKIKDRIGVQQQEILKSINGEEVDDTTDDTDNRDTQDDNTNTDDTPDK